MNNKTRLAVSTALSMLGLIGMSPAQAAAAPAPADNTDIVVTARRSEESIQSVPVSVTALSAATLRENSITTPEDIQLSTPGVYLSGNGGRLNTNFVIRGQSKALSGPSSPGVISYFAEVPNPNFGSYVPQFDLQSVQVLKGPQGTLFGRNTTGGAVLYTPATPTDKFEGYVEGTYGNFENRKLEGVANLPLADGIRLRVGGVYHKRDGYTVDLGHPGRNLDNIDDFSVRGSLWIQPWEGMTNTTVVDFYKSKNNGFSTVLVDVFPTDNLLDLLGIHHAYDVALAQQKARGPFVNDLAHAQYERNRRLSITNRTEWEIGDVTLVNIFGYRDTSMSYNTNSGTPRVIADGTGGIPNPLDLTAFGGPLIVDPHVDLIVASLDNNVHQYTDELQLKGKIFDDKLEWLVGGFWLHSKPSGPWGNLVAFATIAELGSSAKASYNFITEDSNAVFANLRYEVLPGVHIEGGIRYTEDKIQSCAGVGPTDSGADVQPQECLTKLTNPALTKAKSNAVTWQIGANWQATDDLFAYVVSRRGYRAGGVNSPSFAGRLTPFQSFKPETVTDVEAGIRADADLGEAKLRINVSAFVGWYKDVQTALTGIQTTGTLCSGTNVPAPISPDGDCDVNNDPAGGTLLLNLGETRVSGIDIDGFVKFGAFTFNYGANFLDPKTTSFNAPAALQPFISDNSVPFNNTAKKTFTAGIRYQLPVDESLGQVVFNADYYWSDKLMYVGTSLPSYDVVNARLDWNSVAGSPIDVSIYCRNLLDKEYMAAANASGAFLGFTSAIFAPPRTYGLELRYRFGS